MDVAPSGAVESWVSGWMGFLGRSKSEARMIQHYQQLYELVAPNFGGVKVRETPSHRHGS